MKTLHEKDLEFRNKDWGVKYLFRGPKIEWGIILLKPGQKLPCHYHQQVEETFHILEGEPTLIVDGKECLATPGSAFQIPAPETHTFSNASTKNAKILFIKAPYDPNDKIDC